MPYHEGDPQNNHPMTQGMNPTWRCGGCGYTIVSRAEGYCLFCERGPAQARVHPPRRDPVRDPGNARRAAAPPGVKATVPGPASTAGP